MVYYTMDFIKTPLQKVLNKYYLEYSFGCGETYDTFEWYDDRPKPTEEELDLKYDDLLIDEMREERDLLLAQSDYTSIPDFPHKTQEKKQAWLDYRQQLRDFPNVWVPDMPFPTPP